MFSEFNSFFGDCRKSAYGCTEEMTLTKTVRRRMDSLAVNEITDLANLVVPNAVTGDTNSLTVHISGHNDNHTITNLF